jgi:UDP-glucose 4-epimerase
MEWGGGKGEIGKGRGKSNQKIIKKKRPVHRFLPSHVSQRRWAEVCGLVDEIQKREQELCSDTKKKERSRSLFFRVHDEEVTERQPRVAWITPSNSSRKT